LDSFNDEEWKIIFEYANRKQITCFSTPFDEQSADLLYKLGSPAFKIASADITHHPLIKHIASKKLPIFLSTGMASEMEIDEAIGVINDQGNQDVIIMHCITSYPTKHEDANLEIIRTFTKKYPNDVIGYSDHTLGITIPVCSFVYGAKAIEKHFTYDDTLKTSPDHRMSLDTNGFANMVSNLHIAHVSKGKPFRKKFDSESEGVKYARRSICSTQKIPKGTKINKDMVIIKRPGTGIYPKFLDNVLGCFTIKDIEEDMPIMWEDISKP